MADPVAQLEPLLVDRREACRMLGGISNATLDRWRRERGLPCVTIGGRVLFPVERMNAWVNERMEQPALKLATAG